MYLKLSGLCLCLLTLALPAEACRCFTYRSVTGTQTHLRYYDLVFTGTALDTRYVGEGKVGQEDVSATKFQVTGLYRGEAGDVIEIFHHGGIGGDVCGPNFNNGDDYVVSARVTDERLLAGPCDGILASEMPANLRAVLYPPTSESP